MKKYIHKYVICTIVFVSALPASAQITRVNTRNALLANISVEWFAFGSDGATLSTPVSQNVGPLQVLLASSSGELFLSREGTSWTGDFIPGQFLLTQPNVSDNVIISFSPPVTALGTQIDPGHQQGSNSAPYVGPFTARMCLYTATGGYLGQVQTHGLAGTGENNTAKFLGARSAGAPIGRIVLQVSGVTPGFTVEGDMSINRLDVVLPVGGQPSAQATLPIQSPSSCN